MSSLPLGPSASGSNQYALLMSMAAHTFKPGLNSSESCSALGW